MYWIIGMVSLFCVTETIFAQPKTIPSRKNRFLDSIQAKELQEDQLYDLPILTFSESERSETNTGFVSGPLSSNRDILNATAGFHFSVTRFRIRGYTADQSAVSINGFSLQNPDNGYTQWNILGGLNEVSKKTESVFGLNSNDKSFGSLGNASFIDMRASQQWVQSQIGYGFSNRLYQHRISLTQTFGMNKKGWAFSFSGNARYSGEGNIPGTSYQGAGFYLGMDKKINEANLLSFILLGSAMVSGRQGPVLQESVDLLQNHPYNPYWGYQSGKKRNAYLNIAFQPVCILTHQIRINNQSGWENMIGFTTGEKSATGLDWYKASDPRPDYYRYLPGYQSDSLVRSDLAEAIRNDISLQQINWDYLYSVNRNAFTTIPHADGVDTNNLYGRQAHYIQYLRVSGIRRVQFQSVYHGVLFPGCFLYGGFSIQVQRTHNYKRVYDLLGADFYVDWNSFAERDNPADVKVIQNDLNRPDHIVYQGDIYGYDYFMDTHKEEAWLQLIRQTNHFDYHLGLSLSQTSFRRIGNMRNGLFPDNSFGKSDQNFYTHYGIKAGITYKINGRKFFYFHLALLSKPPFFENVYISPATRDIIQEKNVCEKIQSLEAGYLVHTPKLNCRISGYLTVFRNGMDVKTFYHDGYGNLVNYALSGIDQLHAGIETGLEWKPIERFTITGVASIGNYQFTNRPQIAVSIDNNALVIQKSVLYSKNFKVGGTPQQAYSMGFGYRSARNFYLSLFGNYFREHWLDFNPLRRTYPSLANALPGSDQAKAILAQSKLPDQYTVDLLLGSSFGYASGTGKQKHIHTILVNFSINNLLNKKDLITGGYEQLRFDMDTADVSKFPNKYYYASGLNFSVSLQYRIQ
ncbi:MAG: Plug domain-containing protein [Bacteroidota bacterium]|nr:Plug domain-containing protein [Bacteroidota bacterium]